MRIAFLTARPNRSQKVGGYRFYVGEKRPPHGIGFMYAVLREQGFHVDIFDRYCGNTDWPADGFSSYDLVGLYCTSICTDDIKHIIKKVRARRIAVGGPHAHLFPESIPSRVDHVVRGEAESIIADLAAGRIRQRIVETDRLGDADLDRLPRFPWEVFYNRHRSLYTWEFRFHEVKPVFAMSTSRGCPFACEFCSVKKIWGRKLTCMSAERIFADIEYLASLGARGIYFREDNFTANRKRVRELCELLIRSNTQLLWACETRVDTVDDDLMGLMKRAGCVGLYCGLESLSQHMLDVFNKQITVEQILRFFESSRKYGLFTQASLISNHPEETEDDRRETARLLEVIAPSLVCTNQYRKDG